MRLSETIADEAPTTSRWASMLAHGTEIPAALLVLAEIAILGGGAFTRYVLHQPITWTDELASILFIWLGHARSSDCTAPRGAYATHDVREGRAPGDPRMARRLRACFW